jgi:hypothetical protein
MTAMVCTYMQLQELSRSGHDSNRLPRCKMCGNPPAQSGPHSLHPMTATSNPSPPGGFDWKFYPAKVMIFKLPKSCR